MPLSLLEQREKIREEVIRNKERAQQVKDEELVNPWLITEIDCCGNDFC